MSAKIVGVLGGMGPDATVDFMAKVIALTPAEKDQDHIHMLVDHNPKVPNRQAAILEEGEDPGPALAAMAERLQRAGADFLVMPCNTAEVFLQSISDAVEIPVISIVDASIDALPKDCRAAGLLATDGCVRAEIYQSAMAARDVKALVPSADEMTELMTLINTIKAGDRSDTVATRMQQLAQSLAKRGADAIIAGCTEIPLVLDESMLEVPLTASTNVLAQMTVRYARNELTLP